MASIAAIVEIAWSAYKWWAKVDPTVIGSIVVGPEVYFALAMGGVATLGMINWAMFSRIRVRMHNNSPKVKFGRLHDAISAELYDTQEDIRHNVWGDSTRSDADKAIVREELRYEFESLGITPVPSPTDSDEKWRNFLTNMKAFSYHERFSDAKRYASIKK